MPERKKTGIGKRFARRPTVIAEILRSERCRKAKERRAEKEARFRVACRLREANIRELAERFGISLFRAYRIAHKELGASAFRRGPAKPENLPMAAVEPPPAAPLDAPDLYVTALTQFFNIFNDGKVTQPERDSEILVKFLRFVPPDVPDFVRQHVAFSLVRGLDSLRRQQASAWLH